jgi:hypothetical protein
MELEAEVLEQLKDALGGGGVEEAGVAGVEGIEGDADGDRLAMTESELRERLEFVGAPVSEVEGSGRAGFEGIAACGDMLDVEAGGAMDEGLEGGEVALVEEGCMIFDPVEEGGIADEGDFDGFDSAGAEVAWGEGGEEGRVVDDCVRGGEGADEVFFQEGVEAVFDADAGVSLGECGGGEAEVSAAAVGDGGGEAGEVEEGAAADGDDPGVTVDVALMDLGEQGFGGGEVVFGGFASGEDEGWAGELDGGVVLEVGGDFIGEGGAGGGEAGVEGDEGAGG